MAVVGVHSPVDTPKSNTRKRIPASLLIHSLPHSESIAKPVSDAPPSSLLYYRFVTVTMMVMMMVMMM
eukprot:2312597-Rhodomonas_salina.1